ncbi:MAG: putative cytochrome c [Ignavibacteriae bacterium]|nr:MAG: putative cytochrome c [Ignavibacteriota bacterium]
MKNLFKVILFTIILVLFVFQQLQSIPAYARKYDMSCNVCHSPVPKLKPYGNEFAANAYQLKDKEAPRFTRETGDDFLLLMRELPLALRIDGFARYQQKNEPKSDIEWPFIIKILSSGQIAKDISYFFYFLFDERGEIAGVEDAFIYFNNIANQEFDLMVGQYQVADPIFKRELRPTFEDYWAYKIKPEKSKADLTYDRGLMLNYTLPTGTDLFASVLNGNGIGPASDFGFDDDAYKNFFFRVAQSVSDNISIGTLAYLGKESRVEPAGKFINNINMFGADFSLEFEPFELSGQFLYRKDTNPDFTETEHSQIARGGFAELMYAPEGDKSKWYLFLLYNKIKSDYFNYHSIAGNFSYLLARNLKLMFEYGYDLEAKSNNITIGFVTAF